MLHRILAFSLCSLILTPLAASAEPAKAKPKPAPKAPAKPYNPAAGQMFGGEGQFDVQYSAKTLNLAFKVKSLAYTVERFSIDGDTWTPKADEKLLIVRFGIKNPTKEDLYFGSRNLFQAVTANGQTLDDIGYSRRESSTTATADTLKPGQGYEDLLTCIVIPAQGTIKRLIFMDGRAGTQEEVTRYELGKTPNVVQPIPVPYADPAVATGAVPRLEIPAEFGKEYLAGDRNLTVNNVRYTNDAMGEGQEKPEEGFRYLTGEVTVTNGTYAKAYFNNGYLGIKAVDANNEEVPNDNALLKGTRNEEFGAEIDAGKSVKVRFYFPVANDFKAAKLIVGEKIDGELVRPLVFDVTGVK